MFGAAAVRNKKKKQQTLAAANGEQPRGPYIKPFGPRFDPNELPYFKYKRALAEAKELQQSLSKAKKAKARAKAKQPPQLLAPHLEGKKGVEVALKDGGKLKVEWKIGQMFHHCCFTDSYKT